MNLDKIGLGGGCHWCTEAVFLSLRGVTKVELGYVASTGENHAYSEAIIAHYDPDEIPLAILIKIHLLTHQSTSNHVMRSTYRSAIYTFSREQSETAQQVLNDLQYEFGHRLITMVLPFQEFRPAAEKFVDYYYKNPAKPFCKTYIDPKLKFLLARYPKQVNTRIQKELRHDDNISR